MVEHLIRNEEVGGSSPLSGTKVIEKYGCGPSGAGARADFEKL